MALIISDSLQENTAINENLQRAEASSFVEAVVQVCAQKNLIDGERVVVMSDIDGVVNLGPLHSVREITERIFSSARPLAPSPRVHMFALEVDTDLIAQPISNLLSKFGRQMDFFFATDRLEQYKMINFRSAFLRALFTLTARALGKEGPRYSWIDDLSQSCENIGAKYRDGDEVMHVSLTSSSPNALRQRLAAKSREHSLLGIFTNCGKMKAMQWMERALYSGNVDRNHSFPEFLSAILEARQAQTLVFIDSDNQSWRVIQETAMMLKAGGIKVIYISVKPNL